MTRIIPTAVCLIVLTAAVAAAAPEESDFENELEIVDESYFMPEPYLLEEPRPQTITRGRASWTPFDIAQGFSTVHLMNEQACRNIIESLRDNSSTGCMNVHDGRVFYPIGFIGPMMP